MRRCAQRPHTVDTPSTHAVHMRLHSPENTANDETTARDETILCPTICHPALAINWCPMTPGIAAHIVLHLPKHSRQYALGREGSTADACYWTTREATEQLSFSCLHLTHPLPTPTKPDNSVPTRRRRFVHVHTRLRACLKPLQTPVLCFKPVR